MQRDDRPSEPTMLSQARSDSARSTSTRLARLLALAGLAASFAGCGLLPGSTEGSGAIEIIEYDVEEFVAVDVGDDLRVQLEFEPDGDRSLSVAIDDNLHEHLAIATVDGRLTIGTESDIQPSADVIVRVSGQVLGALSVANDASITATLPPFERIDLALDSDGIMTIGVDTDNLAINARSDAELTVTGRADLVDVTTKSDAIVRLGRTAVIDAQVEASSDSVIEVTASDSISGSADSDAIVRTAGTATVDVTTSNDARVVPL